MKNPQSQFSLLEAIHQVQAPVVMTQKDPIKEDEAPAAGEFQGLMDQLKNSFLKYFPNGYFKIQHSKRFGNTVHISCGLIANQRDVSNNIRENDPMFTNVFLHYNEAAGIFEVGSSASGLSINPPEGSHLAMEHVRNPVRKFKTDNHDVVVKKLDQYFAKCKEIVKANWDNIYGVDRIDPKYMVEADEVDLDNDDLEEASAKLQSVNIDQKQLFDLSRILAKYTRELRLKVVGLGKYQIELQDPELLNKDKVVAKLFNVQGNVSESVALIEDGEEVFNNDSGKVISSIKDGRRIFTAYNGEGKIVGKPFTSKAVAVTALSKV